MKGQLMDLGRAFGDHLAPSLISAMVGFGKLTDRITETIDELRQMKKALAFYDADRIAKKGALLGKAVFGRDDDLKNLEAHDKVLEENAKAAEIRRAARAKKRLDDERAMRNGLIKEEDGSTKAAKNPFDKFFQQGVFMFSPSNITTLDIPSQQLAELIEIKRILANPDTQRHTHIEAARALRSIKEGVLGGK